MLFKYSNLEDGCISLLTVDTGQPGSPISCSLSHSGLGDLQRTNDGVFRWSTGEEGINAPETLDCPWVPEYDALSYTWGEDPGVQPHLLDIDGCEFRVTKNLYSSLQMPRRPNADCVLWVDAVCIFF
jgi:hypothetical protein